MANGAITEQDIQSIASVKQHAERAGRDPEKLGFQAQITAPFDPDDPVGRNFHSNPERIAAVVANAKEAGFGWAAINSIAVYVAGARNVDALAEDLEKIHDRVRAEVGRA
jgi:hypothetical protein